MDFLKNKTILRDLLKHGDALNTINGGVSATHFVIDREGEDLLVKVSNSSVSPEAFNFTLNRDQLIISISYRGSAKDQNEGLMPPLFYRAVKLPYYVDINKIEAVFEEDEFRVLLPYNSGLPKSPKRIDIKKRDD